MSACHISFLRAEELIRKEDGTSDISVSLLQFHDQQQALQSPRFRLRQMCWDHDLGRQEATQPWLLLAPLQYCQGFLAAAVSILT